ncbi:MAG: HNH endonuclease [Anaerolineae bacterium]|nr:HNH endonuclease [Anaerolineae bacterium]
MSDTQHAQVQAVKAAAPKNGSNGKNGKHELEANSIYFKVAVPASIVKRDGRIVPFNEQLIHNALERCFASLGREPKTSIDDITHQVVNVVAAKYDLPTVEGVQDIVEMVLQAAGEYEAAKHYILYRAEHAKIRAKRPVPDEVREAFAASDQYFPTQLQKFQFYDKYSRFNYELGRRETWLETVNRAVDYLRELSDYRLPASVYDRIRQGILEMKVMPSMRLLAMAGPAARRNNIAIYNCSYMPVDSIDSFVEALIISMSGCGVGFSVERQYVEQFPRIARQSGKPAPTHVVKDTSEGWAEALRTGLTTWFNGEDVKFDFSEVRPAGMPLRVKGGRASGPEPLRQMLEFARGRIIARQGSFLRPLDAHDMMCAVGNAAVSGGVRRTAMISLFDYDDLEMRHCKDGDFWRNNSQRWNANNSAVWPSRELSQAEITRFVLDMVESGRGEPGIFNRRAAVENRPARRDVAEFGTNPCVTADTLVAVADGRGHVPIGQLAADGQDVPVFCLDNQGKITVRWLRHPRVTGTQQAVYTVTLDDGSTIKVTPNHKFRLKSGEYVAAEDLRAGDSLHVMTRYKASIKDIFEEANSFSQDYVWVNNGRRQNQAEHRLIASFHYNTAIPSGYVVHHKDFNASNNAPDNLEILSKVAHDALHGEQMRGENNPMVRATTEWTDERWADYRRNMSEAVSGEGNGRYSGLSHEQLKQHALNLTRQLGRRFSTQDWQQYAQENGLPQTFSVWRQAHLGGVIGLAKWAALTMDFDHIDADPRVVQSYQWYSEMGYDCEIIEGKLYIQKQCEVCGKPFLVSSKQREAGVCGHSCASKQQWERNRENLLAALHESHNERKTQVQNAQLEIYTALKYQLGRRPWKKEWVAACKNQGISTEISRTSSPFRSYTELEEAAGMYNHRVVSVEFAGYEDVYNGTVDEFHNFFVGGWESQTRHGKEKWTYINNAQCGEIILRPYQFCNLTSAIARADDDYESLRDKVELAAIIGTIQSMATYFPGLRREWQKNCEEERLLGVDLNGQMDSLTVQEPDVQARLREVAVETNRVYADLLGIKQSASVTCVKPSGNSSQLVDSSSGLHARWAPYYIRNVRVGAHSPVFKVLQDAGVPMDPENGQTRDSAITWVVHFPVKSPATAVTRNDRTALEQCEFWLQNKINYTEHNPSVTITYQPNEVLDIIRWVWEHQDKIGGMAFLPAFDAQYDQMPYVEIDQEEYEQLVAKFPEIDFSKIYRYEEEDLTTAAQELACLAGNCDI